MIVPYMSIDLFFVAAPFLCRSERELATFSKRIVAAIVIAGICFLLFPLRFAFGRPPASGWLGRSLRLVSSDGPAVQPPPFAAHHVPNDPGPTLSPAYPRDSALRLPISGLSWSASRPSSPTSITSWTWSPALLSAFVAFTSFASPAPKLPVTENRRIGLYYAIGALILACLAVRILAVGRLVALAHHGLAHRRGCLLRGGPGDFPQGEWPAALECPAGFGPMPVRPARLAALLSPPMPALGPGDAARLDWADTQPRRSRRRRASGRHRRPRSHGGVFRSRALSRAQTIAIFPSSISLRRASNNCGKWRHSSTRNRSKGSSTSIARSAIRAPRQRRRLICFKPEGRAASRKLSSSCARFGPPSLCGPKSWLRCPNSRTLSRSLSSRAAQTARDLTVVRAVTHNRFRKTRSQRLENRWALVCVTLKQL